jgi:hypothetical protein
MARKLYFGREWKERGYGGLWVPFDSDPGLANLDRFSEDCGICLANLYRQLLKGSGTIDMGPAFHCYKPAVVLRGVGTHTDARSLLGRTQDEFLPESSHACGKIGGGVDGSQALLLYRRTRDAALRMGDELVRWAERQWPNYDVSVARACKNMHGVLFGTDGEWKQVMEPDWTKAKEVIEATGV